MTSKYTPTTGKQVTVALLGIALLLVVVATSGLWPVLLAAAILLPLAVVLYIAGYRITYRAKHGSLPSLRKGGGGN